MISRALDRFPIFEVDFPSLEINGEIFAVRKTAYWPHVHVKSAIFTNSHQHSSNNTLVSLGGAVSATISL